METDLLEGYKKTEIGVLPEQWRVVEVGKVGDIVTGTTPSTKVPEYYGPSFPFISPGDIGENKYVEETQKCLSLGFKRFSASTSEHDSSCVYRRNNR